jgi:hypothetical protein
MPVGSTPSKEKASSEPRGRAGVDPAKTNSTNSDNVVLRVPTHQSNNRSSGTSFDVLNNYVPPENKDIAHGSLPDGWADAHDRTICMLDSRGHSLPTIERKFKRRYPEMDIASLNIGILDRRLRWLDYRYDVPHWKEGLGMRTDGGCGVEDDQAELAQELKRLREEVRAESRARQLQNEPKKATRPFSIFKKKVSEL